MPIATKICRVCGKEYEACRSAKTVAGVFRWQEVACSPECGAEYLAKVREARGEVSPATHVAKSKKANKVAANPLKIIDVPVDVKGEKRDADMPAVK